MAGLYRRGKIWWGRARRKGREHRRSLQTANRSIAEKRFRDWFEEIEAVAWGDRPRRSFKDAHDKFICEHLTTLKPGGAKRYGVSLKHLNAHFGGKIDTGLRREELFSLKWSQVDFLRGIVTTTANQERTRSQSPLPRSVGQILAQFPRRLDTSFVLVNPETGTRYIQMNKGLKAAMRRAEILDLRWHDLRRTAGCRWLQRDGKSMEEISILLGHSSVIVTEQRYAFLEAETVAESLGSRTKPGTGTADVIAIKKAAQ
jgi:integrase